jgi:hypothetical protein
VLTNQINIALIVLACQVYSVERPRHAALISLYSLTTAVSLLGLSSGMLENALTPWAVVLIARWHVSRKVAWRLIIVGVFAFAFFNPVKREYRNEVWFGDETVGVVESITIWFQLAGENVLGMIDGSKQGEESSAWMQETTSRLDLLHRFAYVGEMTPAVVPFYRGSTYSYIWTGWIPRFIWPDKPSASESNRRMDVDYVLLEDFQAAETGVMGQLRAGGSHRHHDAPGGAPRRLEPHAERPAERRRGGHLSILDGHVPERNRHHVRAALHLSAPERDRQCAPAQTLREKFKGPRQEGPGGRPRASLRLCERR